MIEIKNFDENVHLLLQGEVVGKITNIMQLQDIRVQIKEQKLEGYSIRYKNEIVEISTKGHFSSNKSNYVPFYKEWTTLCSKLL